MLARDLSGCRVDLYVPSGRCMILGLSSEEGGDT